MTVTKAAGTWSFKYDANNSRTVKQGPSGTTIYFGGLYEKRTVGGTVTHVMYIPGEDEPVAQVTQVAGGTPSLAYFHTDHLGTPDVITQSGGTATRMKFDPFGSRLAPDSLASSPMSTPPPLASVTKGFTGHEEDDELGLINMGGRIYDPLIARFLTADPIVSNPAKSQSLNRYSYVKNSPLVLTDPSGLCDGESDDRDGDQEDDTQDTWDPDGAEERGSARGGMTVGQATAAAQLGNTTSGARLGDDQGGGVMMAMNDSTIIIANSGRSSCKSGDDSPRGSGRDSTLSGPNHDGIPLDLMGPLMPPEPKVADSAWGGGPLDHSWDSGGVQGLLDQADSLAEMGFVPEAANLREEAVGLASQGPSLQGVSELHYNPAQSTPYTDKGTISIGNLGIHAKGMVSSAGWLRSSILHETVHARQEREGRPRNGANAELESLFPEQDNAQGNGLNGLELHLLDGKVGAQFREIRSQSR